MCGVWLIVLALGVAGCDSVFQLHREEGAAGDAMPDVPVGDGLILYYSMEGLDGDKLLDASGHGHHAVCAIGECPQPISGTVGGALQFNGSTTFVRAPSGADFENATALTVAFWLYLDGPAALACPVGKVYGPVAGNSWQLCLFESRPSFQTSFDMVKVDEVITPGTWHHYALRWDGVTLSAAIDAVVRGSLPGSGIVYDAGEILVGTDLDSGGRIGSFSGRIDEVRVYDRALASTELVELTTMR